MPRRLALAVAAAAGLAACGPPCVEVDTACDPLYEPTFDNIHTRTLVPTCALAGCHDDITAERGLSLADADTAYAQLLDGRVDPGDVGCSVLIRRLEAASSSERMPPGSQLSQAERCAIAQWVEAGAPR